MGDRRRARCKRCGKRRTQQRTISWTGLCAECGKAILCENIDGLATMSGEPLARWRRGVAASVGAILLDDVPDAVQTPRRNAA